MAKNHSIVTRDGVMTIRFSRSPSVDDIREAIDDVASSNPPPLRLWDLSFAGLNLTADQLREAAAHGRSKQFPPSKIAIVAPDDLAFGLSRQFEFFRVDEQATTGVFRTEKEALAWLRA